MAFEDEDMSLEDGPIVFEENDYTIRLRLMDDDDDGQQEGVIELAFWAEIDDEKLLVALAYINAEIRQVDVWIDEHDDLDGDPDYVRAVHRFDQVLNNFLNSTGALTDLARDLEAWASADPKNPFGDSKPAEDPIDYSVFDDEKLDIHQILAEFGVTVEDGSITGILSLTDEERQKMYVKLKKLQRLQRKEDEK